MRAYARTRNYPEALVKILLTIIDRTRHGGATLEDLQEAYQEVRDQTPSKKTIDRAIRRLNIFFDPLAYDDEDLDPEAISETFDEEEGIAPVPRAIRTERKGGQTRYLFTRDLTPRSIDPGTAFLMALSLYPQQRGLLTGQFEVVMKLVFEDVLGRLAATFDLMREIENHVYVSGFAPADAPRTLRTIERVIRAIRNRKRVKLEYVRSYDGAKTTREVEPYGLICRFNQWYLVGLCRIQEERRVFLLDNIRRLDMVENSVSRIPPDFSLREAYGRSWGVWTDAEPGRPETVRLRVGRGLAERFRATRFHDSQQARDLPGGELEVTFLVAGAKEMIPWLASWGTGVEVLEPAWLRETLVSHLEDTLEVYNGSPAAAT